MVFTLCSVMIEQVFAIQELEERVGQKTEAWRRSSSETPELNDEIEQFLYTVSHDLKSPLVTAQGFAGLLERDLREGRTDRLAEFAEQIKAAIGQMARLIDDLLNLSRVGRLIRPPERVDMSDLVRKVMRLHDAAIQGRRIDLDIQDDMPVIYADKERIAQIIDNLVSNAVEHGSTNPLPRIEAGGEVIGEEVRFFVRDNGPGIPANYHEKIFDLFERLDSNTDGTGVGLAIVRRAMEIHSGRVWVESTPDQGATFWLAFPRSALEEPGSVSAEG